MKKESNNLDEEELEEEHVPTDEEKKELETLLKAIQDLEKANQESKEAKKSKNFIAIEFGGVFHHNAYVNFTFNLIFNLTLTFLLIEVFNFATYDNIIYIALFVLTYTILETYFRIYVLMNHFQFIVKSLGFIFFFGYVIIFFVLDKYLFVGTISFNNETVFVVFVGMFTIIRYIFSALVRQNFRKRNLR